MHDLLFLPFSDTTKAILLGDDSALGGIENLDAELAISTIAASLLNHSNANVSNTTEAILLGANMSDTSSNTSVGPDDALRALLPTMDLGFGFQLFNVPDQMASTEKDLQGAEPQVASPSGSCRPGLSLRSQILFFFWLRTALKRPHTANRRQPPTPTNCQPPTFEVEKKERRSQDQEAEGVPVNVRFCSCYEGVFFPPSRTALAESLKR